MGEVAAGGDGGGEVGYFEGRGDAFGRKLSGAGVSVDVHTMKGMPHPFNTTDGVLEEGKRVVTLFCKALHGAMYSGE